MAISNANAAKINKMNRASKNVNLGTVVQSLQTDTTPKTTVGATGKLVVSASNSNASVVTIVTTLGSVTGYVLNINQSGSLILRAYVVNTNGSLVLYGDTTASYTLKTNDIINWLVW